MAGIRNTPGAIDRFWSRNGVRVAAVFVGILLVIEVLAASLLPKSVSWDPSFGMLAAQHHLHGRSPDLLHIGEANREDLTVDKPTERGYWAPGYQAIPWAARFGTLSWGTALQITIAVAFVIGLSGWGLYFFRATGVARDALWLMVALLCARYTWLFTVVYAGGDLLLWAAAPWLILANAGAARSSHWLPALAAGAFASSIFLLKYSGLFLTAGLGLAWAWQWWSGKVRRGQLIAWVIGAAVVGGAIKLAGFPAAGHAVATARKLLPYEAVASTGFSLIGATDLEAVFARFGPMLRFRSGWDAAALGLLLTLGLVAVLLLLRIRQKGKPTGDSTVQLFGSIAAVVDIAALAALVAVGSNIAPQARLGRVSGLLLLPAVAMILFRALPKSWLASLALIGLFIVPGTYGVMAGASKLVSAWKYRDSGVGPDGLSCFSLDPSTNHAAFYQELDRTLPGKGTVLLVPYPQLLFPIPERRCIVFDAAVVLSPERLSSERWPGVPKDGVALLLPREFENDRRLIALQKIFMDLREWKMVPLTSDPAWAVWISTR